MTGWRTLTIDFTFWSRRILRLARHLIYPVRNNPGHLKSKNLLIWFLDLLAYLTDLLFIPEIYKVVYLLCKPSIRTLNEAELQLARSVYLDTVDFRRVLIHEHSFIISKKLRTAYVAFGLIHSADKLKQDIFIHELMHVYQYQQYGSAYIVHAFEAQLSKSAYDYGGKKGLEELRQKGGTLFDLNFEQQASVLEHFYELNRRLGADEMAGSWSVYQDFRNDLLESKV